jgi:hypothetical protein
LISSQKVIHQFLPEFGSNNPWMMGVPNYSNDLFTVLRPAQESFTYLETSPLPVKGCKI